MPSDKKHSEIIGRLEDAQEADFDNREMVREADHFLNTRWGQWEQSIIQRFGKKPKYTFDETNPIIDDIMGEMETAEFNCRVTPSGAGATKKTAMIYEGILRTLENISNAYHTYNRAARIMVGTGIDGWRVVQAFRDDNSFQQDLLIRKIPNFQDTVWFDPDAVEPTMEDAEEAWVLTSLTRRHYDQKYPRGSGLSVGTNITQQVYSYKKPDEVIIGEYLYKVKRFRELALMSDGSIYVIDDDFNAVVDELAKNDITIVRTRRREYTTIYQQVFDGGDWLDSSKKTVFSYIPIVPVFGNFRISEGKVIYWSITTKLMDPQRVINYAESRKIEEGALAPRGKVWMTKDQAESEDVRQTLGTLNTNTDPVQFYDHAEGQNRPEYLGAPQSNPGLMETTQSARAFIERTSGTFDEARGAAPAHRSGEAVGLLQAKSDNPKRKWFSAMEVAIQHTAKIIIDACPRVYDTQQEMILTGQDGSLDVVILKKKIRDQQTGRIIELNDLSKGSYDVVCTSGKAFRSRQQETISAINDMAAIDPSIMELGSDILLNNIDAPGIDKLAERKRLQMVKAGLIPESQLTQEEKQLVMQAQQQNKMSPTDQANLQIAAAQEQDVQGRNAERAAKLQIEQQKLQLKQVELEIKAQTEQAKATQQQQQQIINAVLAMAEQVKMQAETLKLIKEAMGADVVVNSQAAKAYGQQATELTDNIGQPTGGYPAMAQPRR